MLQDVMINHLMELPEHTGRGSSMEGKLFSPFQKFLKRHAMLRAFLITVTFMVAFTLIGALVDKLLGSPPSPAPIPAPPFTVQGSSDSPSPPPSPSPVPSKPFAVGSCLTGNFESSSPDAKQVPCSSDDADERVVDVIPGATGPSACQGVDNATLGFEEQEETEEERNGVIVGEIPGPIIVYCLVTVSQ
jgi:hypothetical protein